MSQSCKTSSAFRMADSLESAKDIPHTSDGVKALMGLGVAVNAWQPNHPYRRMIARKCDELTVRLAFLEVAPRSGSYWERAIEAAHALSRSFHDLDAVSVSNE